MPPQSPVKSRLAPGGIPSEEVHPNRKRRTLCYSNFCYINHLPVFTNAGPSWWNYPELPPSPSSAPIYPQRLALALQWHLPSGDPVTDVPWSQGWGTTAPHHTWVGADTALCPTSVPRSWFCPTITRTMSAAPSSTLRVLDCNWTITAGLCCHCSKLSPDLTYDLSRLQLGSCCCWPATAPLGPEMTLWPPPPGCCYCILPSVPNLPLQRIISRPVPLLHPYILARVRPCDPSPSSMGNLGIHAPPEISPKPYQVHLGLGTQSMW